MWPQPLNINTKTLKEVELVNRLQGKKTKFCLVPVVVPGGKEKTLKILFNVNIDSNTVFLQPRSENLLSANHLCMVLILKRFCWNHKY